MPECPSRFISPLSTPAPTPDRKSTRLNSSHPSISYAVFCLKKKNKQPISRAPMLITPPAIFPQQGSPADFQRPNRFLQCRFEGAIYFYGFFFFNDTATSEIYTLSLHDALPI